MYCTQYSVVNTDHAAPAGAVLKCKTWQCSRCEPGRRKALYELAAAGKPNKFVTLTVNPATGIDADDRARSLVHAWQKLSKRLARRLNVTRIPYIWVIEATKKGEPHLHILMRAAFIDKAYLSDVMAEFINAPIVDIKAINNDNAMASYVSKYCSKDARKFAGCKRYSATPNYVIDKSYIEERENYHVGTWMRANMSIEEVATKTSNAGYELNWTSNNSFTSQKREHIHEDAQSLAWQIELDRAPYSEDLPIDWIVAHENFYGLTGRLCEQLSSFGTRKQRDNRNIYVKPIAPKWIAPTNWTQHVPVRRKYDKIKKLQQQRALN